MIKTLLSGDLPRSRVLSAALAAILATLTFAPYDTVPALQAVPGPQVSTLPSSPTLGFSPAAS